MHSLMAFALFSGAALAGPAGQTPGATPKVPIVLPKDVFKEENDPGPDDQGVAEIEATMIYWRWALKQFGEEAVLDPEANPGADPDSDGCDNLCEYVADSNPLVSDAHRGLNLIEPQREYGSEYYILRITEIRDDVEYTLEQSTDLEQWSEEGIEIEVVTSEGIRFRVDGAGSESTRVVRLGYELKADDGERTLVLEERRILVEKLDKVPLPTGPRLRAFQTIGK